MNNEDFYNLLRSISYDQERKIVKMYSDKIDRDLINPFLEDYFIDKITRKYQNNKYYFNFDQLIFYLTADTKVLDWYVINKKTEKEDWKYRYVKEEKFKLLLSVSSGLEFLIKAWNEEFKENSIIYVDNKSYVDFIIILNILNDIGSKSRICLDITWKISLNFINEIERLKNLDVLNEAENEF